jgi:hypothetical protein
MEDPTVPQPNRDNVIEWLTFALALGDVDTALVLLSPN